MHSHILQMIPRSKWFMLACCATLSSLFNCSCISLGKIPSGFVKDPIGSIVKSIHSQSDPEIVKQGFPAYLMLLDTLVLASPDDPDLLYAATLAYSTYCQAFLTDESESERGAKLFGHGKRYGLRLLERMKEINEIDSISVTDFEEALRHLDRHDVPHMYAASTAWLGWILMNTDSMIALADLPKALAVMNRILELDEGYDRGSVHLFYGIYYAVQPRGAGRNLTKSKEHFERAIEST